MYNMQVFNTVNSKNKIRKKMLTDVHNYYYFIVFENIGTIIYMT